MKSLNEIKGVIPAMISCFDEAGNYDEKAQRDLTRFLIDRGVNALYLTGSTGEAFMMNEKSRKILVENVIDEVNSRIPIIVHVGDIGTNKSIDYAKHAEKTGADAISSVPPFYWKFTKEEILSYYRDVSGAVNIPMIVYNIALAGMVDFETIKKLSNIENVKGIKYTGSTHHEIIRIKDEISSNFMIYSGVDEMASSGLAYGSDGIIGSFYNVIPELFIGIYDAVCANDIAKAVFLQKKANAVIFYVLNNHFFDTIKAMLHWADVCHCTVLKPFYRLNSDDEIAIKKGLIEIIKKYDITECEVLNRIVS